jgi:hypothetical protein
MVLHNRDCEGADAIFVHKRQARLGVDRDHCHPPKPVVKFTGKSFSNNRNLIGNAQPCHETTTGADLLSLTVSWFLYRGFQ